MHILDPHFLLQTLGLIGVFAVIFAESGILLGMVLPGDSLLFVAGVFAGQGIFPLWILIVGAIIAAVLGDSLGYWFGLKVGPRLFTKDDSLFLKKSYIEKTREFYKTHGNKTIAFARFVPIVRTFAPVMAGVGTMQYASFLVWNVTGSVSWILLFTCSGYFLSTFLPGGEKFLTLITVGIVLVSVSPAAFQLLKALRKKN
jgi:membrane-associated protein